MTRFSHLSWARRFLPATAALAVAFSSTAFARQVVPGVVIPGAPKARAVVLDGDSLKITAGEVVLLPFSNVTRIITDDDEIARAFFQNGSPVLQGLAAGVTTVEIYQSSGTPRVLTVEVGPRPNGGEIPLPTPNPTPTPLPFTIPPPTMGNTGGSPQIGNPLPPVDGTTPTTANPTKTTSITPSRSALNLVLSAIAAPSNPSQAQFTINYSNPGPTTAQSIVIRFKLDDRVSYVTGSATGDGVFDAAQREVVWRIDQVPGTGGGGRLTLRVEPIEKISFSFDSQATISDAANESPVASAQVRYSTSTTPLLTVFAMPDRFLAGNNGPKLIDVHGTEFESAVQRLQQMSVVKGRPGGLYQPSDPTQRAEYAVMTLNGLNLRDLRDVTQIKFVMGRRSTVNLFVQNADGVKVADLIRNTDFEPGEHTAPWNGRLARGGFAPPGRYTYVCSAKDPRGEVTTLRGTVNVVPTTPLQLDSLPSFVDVKASDWFARYLSVGEKQGLLRGFPDKTFRPRQAISRLEAAVIVVRALGLEDIARQWADKSVGFADGDQIPFWGRGHINVATTIAKTDTGRPIIRGTSGNNFEPSKDLRRDQAALIVQRLIDRETTRRVTISGAIVPGAVVSINSRPISPDGNGKFSFEFDLMTSTPTTVAVIDTRGNAF